jgi:hypothetical protein
LQDNLDGFFMFSLGRLCAFSRRALFDASDWLFSAVMDAQEAKASENHQYLNSMQLES